MQIKDIYQKLRRFALEATGYPEDKVVFANQLSNARPKKPFITINASTFRNIGTPIEEAMDENGKVQTLVSMVFVAHFQAFSDEIHEAEDILSTLYIKFATELQNDVFQGEMAMRKTLQNSTAIPVALNEQIESRAVLEVEIGFNKTTEHQVGSIETVEIDSLVNDYNKELIIKRI